MIESGCPRVMGMRFQKEWAFTQWPSFGHPASVIWPLRERQGKRRFILLMTTINGATRSSIFSRRIRALSEAKVLDSLAPLK